MENVKRLNSIDAMKFFMAFAVISIHTSLVSEIDGEFTYFCLMIVQKAAVPFFFICNGYFAGVSKRKKHKDYAFSFAKMYVVWSIIYLPLDLIKGGYSLLSYCMDFFLKGYHNYSWHLWYLLGLVYGFLLLYVLLKLSFSSKTIHLIAVILYVLGRILTYFSLNYDGNNVVIEQIGASINAYFYSGRLLCVPLYLVIGNDIANGNCKLFKICKNTVILEVLLIVSLILDAVCADNEISYFLIPILFFALVKKVTLPQSVIWSYFGRLSYWIYLVHMYIVFISVEVLKLSSTREQYFVPLISLILATAIVIVEKIRNLTRESRIV